MAQLREPATVAQVSRALGWDYWRVQRAVYHLRHAGKIVAVAWCHTMTAYGPRTAQQYQRVTK